jgi:hypothetical protein
MTMRHVAAAACAIGLIAGLAGCAGSAPRAAPGQAAAGAIGSDTAYLGAAPTISPDDPAYAENGAPRAGQPSGIDTAGAPSPTGNYAPIQHEHHR